MVLIGSKIDEIRVDGQLGLMEKDLKIYEQIGLKAAEIPIHGLDTIRNGRLNERVLTKTIDILGGFDLTYSVHAPNPLNLMDRESPRLHTDVFRASLVFAEAIGAQVLVYHPGRFIVEEEFTMNIPASDEADKQRLQEKEAEIIRQLSDEFQRVTICMENARPYLVHSPYCYAEQMCLLKEQVLKIDRSNVRITLDIGHMFMSSRFYGFDCVDAVKSISGLIAHTHVHDNFGKAIYQHQKIQTHLIPLGKGDSHMPVGWGIIPVKDILATYSDGYEGIFMMELRSRYFDHVAESRDNLEQVLASLGRKPKNGKMPEREESEGSIT